MTQITWQKEITFKGKDNKFYKITIELEGKLKYTQEDIDYIKNMFNRWIGDKGGIAKDWFYIYWKIKRKLKGN